MMNLSTEGIDHNSNVDELIDAQLNNKIMEFPCALDDDNIDYSAVYGAFLFDTLSSGTLFQSILILILIIISLCI